MMMQGYFCKGDVPYKYAQIQLRDGKSGSYSQIIMQLITMMMWWLADAILFVYHSTDTWILIHSVNENIKCCRFIAGPVDRNCR